MPTLNDHPPSPTERYKFCEWANRVISSLDGAPGASIQMEAEDGYDVLERLRNHASTIHSPSARALMFSLDDFEHELVCAEEDDGFILLPAEIVLNLAQRVMEHASH
jgi:hypothetical protein